MIFRRVKAHIEKENWFAVFIDFLIVVVGILIAFQITNWANEKSNNEQVINQLKAVTIEMQYNKKRFNYHLIESEEQFSDLETLRTFLYEAEPSASNEKLNQLLWKIIIVVGIYPKEKALNVLLASDNLSGDENLELIGAIEDWQFTLADLLRVQKDELKFRDGYVNPYFVENLSLSEIVSHNTSDWIPVKENDLKNTLEKLNDSPNLENIIIGRQLAVQQNIQGLKLLQEKTNKIIELLEERTSP